MISNETADAFLAEREKHYEGLSYQKLKKIADEHDGWPPGETVTLDGEEAPYQPRVEYYSGRKPMIVVELFLDTRPSSGRCRYFERYPSGRTERFEGFCRENALLLVLMLMFLFSAGWGIYAAIRWMID